MSMPISRLSSACPGAHRSGRPASSGLHVQPEAWACVAYRGPSHSPLYEAGVRVTVNTDDPLMFGSDLSEEFLLLFHAGVMSAEALDGVRREALR